MTDEPTPHAYLVETSISKVVGPSNQLRTLAKEVRAIKPEDFDPASMTTRSLVSSSATTAFARLKDANLTRHIESDRKIKSVEPVIELLQTLQSDLRKHESEIEYIALGHANGEDRKTINIIIQKKK